MAMFDVPNLGLPLVFMYEGKIFSKEMDGYYHFFNADSPRIRPNSLGCISMQAARNIFANAKFIGTIITLTDDVNIKV